MLLRSTASIGEIAGFEIECHTNCQFLRQPRCNIFNETDVFLRPSYPPRYISHGNFICNFLYNYMSAIKCAFKLLNSVESSSSTNIKMDVKHGWNLRFRNDNETDTAPYNELLDK